jgi:hypothetical protein
MSQPQNLRADELQHPTPLSPLAAAPPTAESDDVVGLVSIATPRLRAVDGRPTATGAATSTAPTAATGAAPGAMSGTTTGATAGVGAGGEPGVERRVPATVRYAESMTEDALALRLQAITRLGVVTAPTTLTSLAAFTTAPAQAREVAGGADEQVAVQAAVSSQAAAAESVAAARKLAALPAGEALVDGAGAGIPGSAETGGSATVRALAVVPEGASVGGSVGRASVGAGDRGSAERASVGGVGVPEAGAWASRLVQAVSEVLAGDRPISQLVRFTDDAVFSELNRRVRMLGLTTTATSRGAKERSAVRSVRVSAPTEHVAEVAAHVRHGERSRAIALRMEIRRNRWVCTALELG